MRPMVRPRTVAHDGRDRANRLDDGAVVRIGIGMSRVVAVSECVSGTNSAAGEHNNADGAGGDLCRGAGSGGSLDHSLPNSTLRHGDPLHCPQRPRKQLPQPIKHPDRGTWQRGEREQGERASVEDAAQTCAMCVVLALTSTAVAQVRGRLGDGKLARLLAGEDGANRV